MRIMQYPALRNAALDQEDENQQLIPGAWRDQANRADMINIGGGNAVTRAANRQREYYNSPVGAVAWQNDMI